MRLSSMAPLLGLAMLSGCGRGQDVNVRTQILPPSDVTDPYAGLAEVRVSLWQDGYAVGTRTFSIEEDWTLPRTGADLSRPVTIQVSGIGSGGNVVMNGRTSPLVPSQAGDRVFGIFFSPPGAFALAPTPLGSPRSAPGIIALADGRVVVAGGADGTGTRLAAVDLYDPDTGIWTPLPDLSSARLRPALVELADGRVLVAGGEDAGGEPLADAAILSLPDDDDPLGSIAAVADMPQAARARQGSRLPSGKVLLAGGFGATEGPAPAVFDPVADSWEEPAGGLPASDSAVTALPDGGLAIVGGTYDGAALARVQWVRELDGVVAVEVADVLEVPRTGASVNLVNPGGAPEILLVSGGTSGQAGAVPIAAMELVTLVPGAFSSGFAPERDALRRVSRAGARIGDGRILLAGGRDASGEASALAQMWDPVLGRSERTGALRSPRTGRFDQAPLRDGTVMFAGASGATGVEIYNPPVEPLTGSTRVDFAVTPRSALRAGGGDVLEGAASFRVRLYDLASRVGEGEFPVGSPIVLDDLLITEDPLGLVLEALDSGGSVVAWGATSGELGAQAQQSGGRAILLARAGEFNLGPDPLPAPHGVPAVALLEDGRVVVAGGRGGGQALTDFYDPTDGLTGPLPGGDLPTPLGRILAFIASNGRLFIPGGADASGNPTAATQVLDLETAQWLPGSAPVPMPVDRHRAVELAGGDVFSYGAWDGAPAAGAFRWNEATAQWSTIAGADKRASASAVGLDDGRVLIAAGVTSSGVIALSPTARVYDPAVNGFQEVGMLATARRDHAGFSIGNGEAVVCGGHSTFPSAGTPAATCERFSHGAFTLLGTDLNPPRHDIAVLPLPDGRVFLIGGGDTASTSTNAVDYWDPPSASILSGPPMVHAREEAAAVLLPDGRIVVAGGEDDGDGTRHDQVEIYTPAAWTNPYVD